MKLMSLQSPNKTLPRLEVFLIENSIHSISTPLLDVESRHYDIHQFHSVSIISSSNAFVSSSVPTLVFSHSVTWADDVTNVAEAI